MTFTTGSLAQTAAFNLNQSLYFDQPSFTLGYLYMTAHFLVQNLRASSQGINGQFDWLHAGKGVGAVNESFTIPQRIQDHVIWSMFTKTNYGMMFLQLILPQMCGVVYSVQGTTRA